MNPNPRPGPAKGAIQYGNYFKANYAKEAIQYGIHFKALGEWNSGTYKELVKRKIRDGAKELVSFTSKQCPGTGVNPRC